MATAATAGYGTLLKRNGTTIAECRNISGPNITLGTVDATHQTSTGAVREYIATLLDSGEITFEVNFLPTDATHSFAAGLGNDMTARTFQAFSLVLTDAGLMTATFSAYVTSFALTAPLDGKLTANFTLKISGPITWTP